MKPLTVLVDGFFYFNGSANHINRMFVKNLHMKSITLYMLFSLLIVSSCTMNNQQQATEKSNDSSQLSVEEQAFMNNLRSLCGKSFAGEQSYMAEGRESWAHFDFVMHVTVCEEDKVHIPFHLSNDHSRTWQFLVEDGRLRFRHDHRHEDGSPEDQTLYGGYADGTGNEFVQYFPADDYTRQLLNDTLGRKWTIVLAEDLSTMKYQLSYHDQLIFEGTFDLNKPMGE